MAPPARRPPAFMAFTPQVTHLHRPHGIAVRWNRLS